MSYTKYEINKNIRDVLEEKIPPQIIHQREGGKRKNPQTGRWEKVILDYISGSTVIDYLNRAFGYGGWEWKVDKYWIQSCSPKKAGKWDKDLEGKPIPEGTPIEQSPVAMVLGTLTVHFKDEDDGSDWTISKMGFGSKSVVGAQSEQESEFKAAGTDALKKAASLLGIGAELYRKEEEQVYFQNITAWSEEDRERYKKEWAYLDKVKADNNLSDQEMDEVVAAWDEGAHGDSMAYIVPENITKFVKFVKTCMSTAEEEQKEA